MRINRFDHLVVTTRDFEQCRHFYVDLLGMELIRTGEQHAFRFGNHKINVHCGKAEFLPAARNPEFGSADFCLIAEGDIKEIFAGLQAKNAPFVLPDIVERTGATGLMDSIYLRDPDGSLVEISVYR